MDASSTRTMFDEVIYPAITGGILWLLTLLILVMVFFNRGAFRRFSRPSLAYAGIVLALTGTGAVMEALYTDAELLIEPGEDQEEALFILWFTTGVSLAGATLLAWLAYIVASGEWERVEPDWQVALIGDRGRLWRAIGMGGIVAVGLVVLTELMMGSWTIEVHPIVQEQMDVMPRLREAPWWVGLPYLVGTFAGAAFYEELLFRGALLGVLMSRVRCLSPWVHIVVVALAFGAMHLLNTTAPLLKVSQTALIGVATGWLAWRRGLEAAISCHVIFNLAVVSIEVLQGDV